jgi:TM2 domain-containing membrane protein YozV
MSKIIKVDMHAGVAYIGMDDNSIKQARLIDLNFTPHIGDEVEVFEDESNLIVVKKENTEKKESVENDVSTTSNGAININVSNNQCINGPTYTGAVATNKRVVNKITYALLAIFLGSIGVHHFYAGYNGKGITSLLLCWTAIPAIIAFIEGICALCKTADANGNILV